MTSDIMHSTEVSELPFCNVCPGPDTCYRVRRATLVSAYVAGCRSPEARAANTAYAAERRARAAGTASTGTGWDAPDVAASAPREPTGETCSECDRPMMWERGRAGQSCDSGHWSQAPGTESRVMRTRVRTVNPEPSVMDIVKLDVAKSQIIRECHNAITRLDVSQLTASYERMQVATPWNELVIAGFVASFNSLIKQARNADNPRKLAAVAEGLREINCMPQYGRLIGQMQQEVTELLARVNSRARNGVRYEIAPGTNTIRQIVTRATVNREIEQ